ncbi:MAG: hypothetical protein Q4G27_05620 [Flavobacteriaceae bacterium]|nr:hypothetical protein [Flavobacteriaceae bacterium]
MKKTFIIAGLLGLSAVTFGQQNLVTQYPEELYQYGGSGSMGGTARFQSMSGAMGALGGDLSAVSINPAGAAVFLNSEGAITAGVNMSKYDLGNHAGDKFSDSKFNLDQLGAVLVFDQLNSSNWRNVAIAMNYQNSNIVNEALKFTPNTSNVNGDRMSEYYTERSGSSSVTSIDVAANYQDKIYIGGGFKFHTFEALNFEAMRVFESAYDNSYNYIKDFTPNSRVGSGVSASVGIIGKVNQNLRLGASYQSPTWYVDNEEVLREYAMYNGSDSEGDYYYISSEQKLYLNDLTSAHKFTGSAALVLGQQGLISADYTYTDYSSAKFKPEDSFSPENQFIENAMKGTSSVKIGAEARFNDFRVRGGFRYEQSPFEETDLLGNGDKFQLFGDLTGFSLGAGYNFNNFYIDAAYSMYQRDRAYVVAGNFYDNRGSVSADEFTQEEALNALSLNAAERGFQQSLKDVKEQQGNIALTVGFRF